FHQLQATTRRIFGVDFARTLAASSCRAPINEAAYRYADHGENCNHSRFGKDCCPTNRCVASSYLNGRNWSRERFQLRNKAIASTRNRFYVERLSSVVTQRLPQ